MGNDLVFLTVFSCTVGKCLTLAAIVKVPGVSLRCDDIAILVLFSKNGVSVSGFLNTVGFFTFATVDFDAVELAHRTARHLEHHVAVFFGIEVIAAAIVGVVVAVGHIPLRAAGVVSVVGVNHIVQSIAGVGNMELHGLVAAAITAAHVNDDAVVFLQFRDDELTTFEEANIAVGVSYLIRNFVC